MPANTANRAQAISAPAQVVMLTLMLVVAAFSSAASAQWTEPDTPTLRFLKQADTNGDGQLSPEERQAAREKLRAFRDRQQQQKKQRRNNLGSGDALGSVVHTIPATIDPENTKLYKPNRGPHSLIKIDTFTLEKAGYTPSPNEPGRDIELRVTLPGPHDDDAAPQADSLPVVVFCHGALGSKDGYLALTEFWASHGYAIIQPTFGDSISLMTPEQKAGVTSVGQLLASNHVTSQWYARPREVEIILSRLDEIENTIKADRPTKPKITFNRDRVAVAGHSYGAHTTMLLTGAAPRVPGAAPRPLPNRVYIKAGIALSPQGVSPTFQAKQFERFNLPMLFVTGDNDGSPMPGQLDKKGNWRREAYDHAPQGPRYLLWLDDAHHNLGGVSGATFPGAGPASPDQVLLIQSTVLAFLDAHLSDNADAKKYLASDLVREVSNDLAHVENKLQSN